MEEWEVRLYKALSREERPWNFMLEGKVMSGNVYYRNWDGTWKYNARRKSYRFARNLMSSEREENILSQGFNGEKKNMAEEIER